MFNTDDTRPHYGKMPPAHERGNKRIFLAHKYHIDGETATMQITIGTMEDREAFIDSLPLAMTYEGYEGLEKAFREWLKEQKIKR